MSTRRTVAISFLCLTAFVVTFLVYEFALSGLVQARSQRILLSRFRFLADGGLASTVDWQPEPGDPIGILSIPRLGIEVVIVEGTSSAVTTSGPGHLRDSSLPGRPGNSVIAARRTTFAAPFRELDALQEGDEITVTTGVGAFTYQVGSLAEVRPGDPDVLGQTRENQLTLVTSAPPYRASGRLVVTAGLSGDPAPQDLRPVEVIPADETGLSGQPWALAPLLLLAELLVVALLAGRFIARRISRRVAWLLVAPLSVALLWAIFGSMNHLLPATL